MSGDPVYCQCPASGWLGTVPPVCPVHNPQSFTYPTANVTGTTIDYGTWNPALLMPRICDADIERIAIRVAELLRPRVCSCGDNEACDACQPT